MTSSTLPRPYAAIPTYLIRDHQVVLDEDLARVFGVETRRLNEQVRRNLGRFDDYAFQLTTDEFAALMSQIATSKTGCGGRRKPPWCTPAVARVAFGSSTAPASLVSTRSPLAPNAAIALCSSACTSSVLVAWKGLRRPF